MSNRISPMDDLCDFCDSDAVTSVTIHQSTYALCADSDHALVTQFADYTNPELSVTENIQSLLDRTASLAKNEPTRFTLVNIQSLASILADYTSYLIRLNDR